MIIPNLGFIAEYEGVEGEVVDRQIEPALRAQRDYTPESGPRFAGSKTNWTNQNKKGPAIEKTVYRTNLIESKLKLAAPSLRLPRPVKYK